MSPQPRLTSEAVGATKASEISYMKAVIGLVAGAALAIAIAGCDKGESKPAGATTAANAGAAAGAVEVPADGKKFDPPIKPEQLPSGAWYCDMGTVHWAQMNEGDKTCPICKMNLKQKK